MFCKNCGTELPDNARFCKNCGTPVSNVQNTGNRGGQAAPPVPGQGAYRNETTAAPPVRNDDFVTGGNFGNPYRKPYQNLNQNLNRNPYPQGGMPYGSGGAFRNFGITDAQNYISQMSDNSLFKAATITLTIAILLHFIAALATSGQINDALDTFMGSYSSGVASLISGSSFGLTLLSEATNIIFAVGLWLIYAARIRNTRIQPASFTLFQISIIIQVVVMCIAMIVIIIMMGAAGSIYSSYDSQYGISSYIGFNPNGMIAAVIIIAIVLALLDVYFAIQVVRMAGSAKAIMMTGNGTLNGSRYVSVICMIVGVLGAIGAFLCIGLSFLSFLQYGCLAAANIMFSLLIGRIRYPAFRGEY